MGGPVPWLVLFDHTYRKDIHKQCKTPLRQKNGLNLDIIIQESIH